MSLNYKLRALPVLKQILFSISNLLPTLNGKLLFRWLRFGQLVLPCLKRIFFLELTWSIRIFQKKLENVHTYPHRHRFYSPASFVSNNFFLVVSTLSSFSKLILLKYNLNNEFFHWRKMNCLFSPLICASKSLLISQGLKKHILFRIIFCCIYRNYVGNHFISNYLDLEIAKPWSRYVLQFSCKHKHLIFAWKRRITRFTITDKEFQQMPFKNIHVECFKNILDKFQYLVRKT